MSNHPYLRAYMAGISVPTPLLLIPLTAFFMARFVYNIPVPVERVIIFPMAIITNFSYSSSALDAPPARCWPR